MLRRKQLISRMKKLNATNYQELLVEGKSEELCEIDKCAVVADYVCIKASDMPRFQMKNCGKKVCE